MSLRHEIDACASENDFSGVVRVRHGRRLVVDRAYGLADRSRGVAVTAATRFGIASGTKGLTALTVASLVASGELSFDTRVRDVLGDVLPLVLPEVTVEHLVAHTSGIGDYLDESLGGGVDDYVLDVPVDELDAPWSYLPLLVERPRKHLPDEQFTYCNSGYVILSMLVETVIGSGVGSVTGSDSGSVSGSSFYDLVRDRVLVPAGMTDTAFLRSDELPEAAAIGYLSADPPGRTNRDRLPVRGAGDGGAYSTAADVERLWDALFAGRLLPLEMVERLLTPRSATSYDGWDYGLGFWLLTDGTAVMLEGIDAGVSFRTVHDAASAWTSTVISNTSQGAWRIADLLDARRSEFVR